MPELDTKIWLTIRRAVEQCLSENRLAAAWPNENIPNPANEYVRVSYIPNAPVRFAVNPRSSASRPGIIQLMLMSELNRNIAVARETASKIAVHFDMDTVLQDAVQVRIIHPPHIGQSVPSGAYLETPITIQYLVLY